MLDYDPPNQTVTVQPGVTLTELQDRLLPEGQWLPLRPFPAGPGTLGGILALNRCDPERLRYGPPRDLALGLRFVCGTGEEIKAGGRVMKNVAGYDLVRLLAGSAGTLGFLTEITFRVSTAPEACLALSAVGSFASIAAAAAEALGTGMKPAFLVARPVRGGPHGLREAPRAPGWRLTFGLEGPGPAVKAVEGRCGEIFSRHGLQPSGSTSYPLTEGCLADEDRLLWASAFLVRVDLPLSTEAGFFKGLPGDLEADHLCVDFGCGRLRVGLSGLTGAGWEALCTRALDLGGHALLERAPAEFKKGVDIFGPSRATWKWMKRIKKEMDPHDVFSSHASIVGQGGPL